MSIRRKLRFAWLLLSVFIAASPLVAHEFTALQQPGMVRFAVIGDFGMAGSDLANVAALIKSWSPDFIITTGDNNYDFGEAATIDANIGQYFHEYIDPYRGAYGDGADVNRFFPVLGNHDWYSATGAQPYLDYFTLPGNERYYDFTAGTVHFFMLDSDSSEPDGIDGGSTQANWLKNGLATSTARWKLVVLHHAPFSSGDHGSNPTLQWAYDDWGATAVLAGHDHHYERILIDGLPYFVNGLGGKAIYNIGDPIPGSMMRYNRSYGAMLVEASENTLTFWFYAVTNPDDPIDTFMLQAVK